MLIMPLIRLIAAARTGGCAPADRSRGQAGSRAPQRYRLYFFDLVPEGAFADTEQTRSRRFVIAAALQGRPYQTFFEGGHLFL